MTRWLPLVAWALEDETHHTRLNVFPSTFSRDPNERFESRVRLYGRNNKLEAERTFADLSIDRPLRLDLRDLMRDAGVPRFEGLMEVETVQTGAEPDVPRFLESWVDIYSNDHSFDVSIPANPIVGSIKVPFGGEFCYQLYPGVIHSADRHTSVLVLNPYSRVVDVRFTLHNQAGAALKTSTTRIAARDFFRQSLDQVFEKPAEFLAPSGIGSIVIASSFKLIEFVLVSSKAGGETTSWLDHLVPFIEEINKFEPGKSENFAAEI